MALVQLTDAGIAILDNATGPVTIDSYKLGSAFNYTPAPTDTDIHGAEVYSGIPSLPLAINANIVKYSIYLDYDVGPFQFGEFGLYVGTTLFALGSMSSLLQKELLTSINTGNSIRIDIYLSMIGTNYSIWLDLNQSNNKFRLGILQSPDNLPPSHNAIPNAYVITGSSGLQSAFLAYTDTNGLWNFDAYSFAQQAEATIIAFDNQSVTLDISEYVTGMTPAYFGEVILQFTTGNLFGICRYVKTAVVSAGTVTLGFNSPLAILPIVGDKFAVQGRQILSTQVMNLPIASDTILGAIKVGNTLTIDPLTGILNISSFGVPVISVNGKVGAVVLNISDIVDAAPVAISNDYNDLDNLPTPGSVPIATTTQLGVIKAPPISNGTIDIAVDGTIDLAFDPVKTVNGISPDPGTGNVVIPVPGSVVGLVNPTEIGTNTDLDTVITTGLYYITAANIPTITNGPVGVTGSATVEVIQRYIVGPGDLIQRLMTDTQLFWRGFTGGIWSVWASAVELAVTVDDETILATSDGQQNFVSSGYTPGAIEVYVAGLHLAATDYTASDGVNVLLSVPLAAQIVTGTVITLTKFNPFEIANAVTAAELSSSMGASLIGFNSTTVGAVLNGLDTGTLEGKFTSLAGSQEFITSGVSYQIPTDGFEYTISFMSTVTILEPAGPLAAGTLHMPAASNGQRITISSTQNVTTLLLDSTVPGVTINNPINTLAAGVPVSYLYLLAPNAWYRI